MRLPVSQFRRCPITGEQRKGSALELIEIEILILRGLDAKPALDISGGIVDDNMSEN